MQFNPYNRNNHDIKYTAEKEDSYLGYELLAKKLEYKQWIEDKNGQVKAINKIHFMGFISKNDKDVSCSYTTCDGDKLTSLGQTINELKDEIDICIRMKFFKD